MVGGVNRNAQGATNPLTFSPYRRVKGSVFGRRCHWVDPTPCNAASRPPCAPSGFRPASVDTLGTTSSPVPPAAQAGDCCPSPCGPQGAQQKDRRRPRLLARPPRQATPPQSWKPIFCGRSPTVPDALRLLAAALDASIASESLATRASRRIGSGQVNGPVKDSELVVVDARLPDQGGPIAGCCVGDDAGNSSNARECEVDPFTRRRAPRREVPQF